MRALFPNRQVAILRYYAVVDPHDNSYVRPVICVATCDFERHVRYFVRRYRVLSLDEVIDALRHGKPLPANAVVFAFDDGYADNSLAAEILKRYNVDPSRVMLTGEQLRQMARNGMIIGGHTMIHLHLPNADPADVHQEIACRRQAPQKKLKILIRHFSVPNSGPYPYYSERIRQTVAKCGYHFAGNSFHLSFR